MSTMTLGDGQGLDVNIPYADLRALVFENASKVIPGVTRAPGNPPAWIEFDATVLPGRGIPITVKQANIVLVSP